MDLSHLNIAANEPCTLPLPFPTRPRSLADELSLEAANEPPSGPRRVLAPDSVAQSALASGPEREPRFQWEPAWRGQDARLERDRLFETLGAQWREERRRRSLEAILASEPSHPLPFRPYGDPTPRGAAR